MIYDEKDSYFIKYLLENLPQYIFWKDENLVFKWCNKKFAQQFGCEDSKGIIGKTDYDFPWSPSLRDKYIRDDKQILSSGGAKLNYEEEQRQPDGSIKTVLVSKTPVYDKNNKALGILGVYTDITDRKKAERLQIEKESAEKATRVIEMISGCVAHEVRTPLSIIKINIDGLQVELNKILMNPSVNNQKDKVIKFVSNIKFAINSASNIVTMLLVKLRNVLNKAVDDKNFGYNKIKSCINEAIIEYPFYNSEHKDVVWDDKSNIDFIYRGDNLLTKHVLFNLIKNSLKAIKEVERGKIFITLNRDKKFNYLIFRDTASGISADFFATLFHQFDSHSKEGSGLGLAFCKMVMRSYGGDITCDSKEGEYTEFTLVFPKV